MNLFVGRAQLHPFPAVPRLAAAHGGGGAGGLAALRAQGPGLQGGAGQPHLQVVTDKNNNCYHIISRYGIGLSIHRFIIDGCFVFINVGYFFFFLNTRKNVCFKGTYRYGTARYCILVFNW